MDIRAARRLSVFREKINLALAQASALVLALERMREELGQLHADVDPVGFDNCPIEPAPFEAKQSHILPALTPDNVSNFIEFISSTFSDCLCIVLASSTQWSCLEREISRITNSSNPKYTRLLERLEVVSFANIPARGLPEQLSALDLKTKPLVVISLLLPKPSMKPSSQIKALALELKTVTSTAQWYFCHADGEVAKVSPQRRDLMKFCNDKAAGASCPPLPTNLAEYLEEFEEDNRPFLHLWTWTDLPFGKSPIPKEILEAPEFQSEQWKNFFDISNPPRFPATKKRNPSDLAGPPEKKLKL